MEKIKILIISTVIIFLLFPFLMAADEPVTVTTENASAARGEEIRVNVLISESLTVTSGAVELIYDENILEFVDGECMLQNTLITSFDDKTEKGLFLFSSPTAINGNVFSVTFRVRENAALISSDITLKLQMKDSDQNDIVLLHQAGQFTLTGDKHSSSGDIWVGTDSTYHWRACSHCGQEYTDAKALHSYTEYSSNRNGTHTGTCICSQATTENCHGDDASATCIKHAVCSDCGGAYGSLAVHDYDTSTWGYITADGHAHTCRATGCTAHDDIRPHSLSGSSTCIECLYIATKTPNTDPANNETGKPKDEPGDTLSPSLETFIPEESESSSDLPSDTSDTGSHDAPPQGDNDDEEIGITPTKDKNSLTIIVIAVTVVIVISSVGTAIALKSKRK